MNTQDGASEKNRDGVARRVRPSDKAISDSQDIVDRVAQGKSRRPAADGAERDEDPDADERA